MVLLYVVTSINTNLSLVDLNLPTFSPRFQIPLKAINPTRWKCRVWNKRGYSSSIHKYHVR